MKCLNYKLCETVQVHLVIMLSIVHQPCFLVMAPVNNLMSIVGFHPVQENTQTQMSLRRI
jgi:hypothetical protein